MTHCRLSREKWSAVPIEGRATFTMETSSTVRKKAAQTSASAFQRRGSGPAAAAMRGSPLRRVLRLTRRNERRANRIPLGGRKPGRRCAEVDAKRGTGHGYADRRGFGGPPGRAWTGTGAAERVSVGSGDGR